MAVVVVVVHVFIFTYLSAVQRPAYNLCYCLLYSASSDSPSCFALRRIVSHRVGTYMSVDPPLHFFGPSSYELIADLGNIG